MVSASCTTVLGILAFTSAGGRVSTLVPTALMFLLFSLPLIFFVIDHNPVREKKPIRWRESIRDTMQTIRDSKNYPGARRFIPSCTAASRRSR